MFHIFIIFVTITNILYALDYMYMKAKLKIFISKTKTKYIDIIYQLNY